MPRFVTEAPFDASTLVHFRKRLSAEMLKAINERIALQGLAGAANTSQEKKETPPPPPLPFQTPSASSPEAHPPSLREESKPPQGKLLTDATCAPEDIHFPHDLSLLNEAREVTEAITVLSLIPRNGFAASRMHASALS
ncbi:MAG: hypothetical protein M3Y08_07425 [Fibrobacterota bacterium]|nr:hypothetical protein [Fibrobacterota bacterium]